MDFNHKVSTDLVRAHDLLAFEDLKVRNMVRNHSLAKSIHDAGWEQLIRFSEYKAERVGKLLVRVPPAYSTRECCFCGAINNIGLEVREFECVGCGRKLDRDLNASGIVLKRGLAQVGQGMPELTPVEIAPPLLKSDLGASAVMEAGTIRGGLP